MKKLLVILVFAGTIPFTGCTKEKKYPVYTAINGKVISISRQTYEAEDKYGEIIPGDLTESDSIFLNRSGQIERIVYYDQNGDMAFSRVNSFSNGKCLSSKDFQKYDNSQTVSKPIEFSDKKEVWEVSTGEERKLRIVTRTKNQVETVTKREDGEIISTVILYLDKDRNTIELKSIGPDEDLIYWEKNRYDEKRFLTEKKILEGSPEGIHTYSYPEIDKKGNWLKSVEYLNGELISMTVREIAYR